MTVAEEVERFADAAKQLLMRRALDTARTLLEKSNLLVPAEELFEQYQASEKFIRIKELIRNEAAMLGLLAYLEQESRRRREWEDRVERAVFPL